MTTVSTAGVSFGEAIDYARSRKVVLPEEYYGRFQGRARATAFSVAGVASMRQLRGVLDSLNTAMADGETFADWKKRVAAGEVQLGLPEHRLQTIFRTNVQGAYAVGRYEQYQRNAARRPYLMYDAINDSRTRPRHRALDNFIAPLNDPIWLTHLPPLGFNCRCTTIALTEAQAKVRGYDPTKRPPSDVAPDPGWDYDKRMGPQDANDNAAARLKPALPPPVVAVVEERKALTDAIVRMADPNAARRLGEVVQKEIDGKIDASIARDTEGYTVAFRRELLDRIRGELGAGSYQWQGVSKRSKAGRWLSTVSERLPASWARTIDEFGPLDVKFQKSRAYAIFAQSRGQTQTLRLREDFDTVLHETMHLTQGAMPGLNAIFEAEHRLRTGSDPLRPLRVLDPGVQYGSREWARKDQYLDPYFGKEYALDYNPDVHGQALEVLTMSFEAVLGARIIQTHKLRMTDPRLFQIVIGTLFGFYP